MTTKAKTIEGRKRILYCLALCGGEQQAVILLELQKAYLANYGSYLNKEEVRKFFGKGHIKQVFEQFMKDDVTMGTNVEETGSLYLQLKRPLAEALAASPSMNAKKNVPVMPEPKNVPVRVPLPIGPVPKFTAAQKKIGTMNKAFLLTASAEHMDHKMIAAEENEIQKKQFEYELKLMARLDEYSEKEYKRAMALEKMKMANLKLTKENLQLEIELEKMKLEQQKQ